MTTIRIPDTLEEIGAMLDQEHDKRMECLEQIELILEAVPPDRRAQFMAENCPPGSIADLYDERDECSCHQPLTEQQIAEFMVENRAEIQSLRESFKDVPPRSAQVVT